MTPRPRGQNRNAFTLVEMLVVVAIIGILAAIIVPAVYMGLGAANDARIALELANIDAAMRQYKSITHGYAYPPNFVDDAKVRSHIRQKFGRYNPGVSGVVPPTGLDAAETLVFWLQGYNPNPLKPLGTPTSTVESEKARKELFDFDESRLVPTRVVGGFQLYHYHPRSAQSVPFVYFHHDSDGDSTLYEESFTGTGAGTIRAYKRDGGTEFVNKDSYQIISAGQDGDWGLDNANKQFPAGTNYTVGDRDNITNFSEGTMGDKIP